MSRGYEPLKEVRSLFYVERTMPEAVIWIGLPVLLGLAGISLNMFLGDHPYTRPRNEIRKRIVASGAYHDWEELGERP